MKKGISIIIPTYNGGKIFSQCLERIGQQDYGGRVQLIVIDSGSTDGTTELARKAGALVKEIDKRRFHHARTRNEALSFARFDRVVYAVQDIIPCSNGWLSALEHSLYEAGAGAVYTDQVPHDDATPYASYENECIRNFRGEKALLQGLASAESFRKMPYLEAYRTIALDNVCAIYRKELLVNIPFPEMDFAEDLAWSLKNMLSGHRVLYQPDIKVRHSHNRLPEYVFHRLIVNSFWCAKIMNRVRDDMSFLSIEDLLYLTSGVGEFAGRLKSEILAEIERTVGDVGRFGPVIERIVKKYSLKNRLRWFLINNLSMNTRGQSSELRNLLQQINDEIRGIFCSIKEHYGISTKEELLETLEQITAYVLGRVYGEVYASRMLNGKISSGFESFMKPYMYGI